MAQEYTPTDEEVRAHYAAHRLVTLEVDDNDLPTSYVVRRLDQVYGPEFDRWLRKVKAEAWREGYLRRATADFWKPITFVLPNPYESEES